MARNIEPTLAAVDGLCVEVRRRLEGRASAPDWFGVELLLREALTNAVRHGGNGGAARRVRCEVRLGARKARVAVADGGAGFDWRSALAASPPENATSGRGLRIDQAYADRVTFNRSGNRVVLERRLERSDEGEAR